MSCQSGGGRVTSTPLYFMQQLRVLLWLFTYNGLLWQLTLASLASSFCCDEVFPQMYTYWLTGTIDLEFHPLGGPPENTDILPPFFRTDKEKMVTLNLILIILCGIIPIGTQPLTWLKWASYYRCIRICRNVVLCVRKVKCKVFLNPFPVSHSCNFPSICHAYNLMKTHSMYLATLFTLPSPKSSFSCSADVQEALHTPGTAMLYL